MGFIFLFLALAIICIVITFTWGPNYLAPSFSPSVKEGVLSKDGKNYIGDREASPFIKSYQIFYHSGSKEKFARVIYTEETTSIAYDLYLFDSNHKPFKVYHMNFGMISKTERSHYVKLPKKTAGLRLILRRVNGRDFPSDDIVPISQQQKLKASIITAVFAGFSSLCLSFAFYFWQMTLFGGRPSQSVFYLTISALAVMVLAFVFLYFIAPIIENHLYSPSEYTKEENPDSEEESGASKKAKKTAQADAEKEGKKE